MTAAAAPASAALRRWIDAANYVDLAGRRLACWSTPDVGKPILLLIHGFPTAAWDWSPLWSDLAQRFQLIAPDLLGFGLSDKPAAHDYSLLEQADLLEALLERRGRPTFHVLAHDYGDSIAQELLARHQARAASGSSGPRLQSVIFLNGGLFPERHRPRLIQKLLASPIGSVVARLLDRRRFGTSFCAVFGPATQPTATELDDFWYLIRCNNGHRLGHRLIAYIAERKLHRERWVAAMQNTGVPLRFINGLLDPISGAHMVERYRELIAHADVVALPEVGHYPQVEAPLQVLAAANAFWDRIGA